jgi:NhaA family Na+:H+ antiporter
VADEQPGRPHLRTPWSRSRRTVPRVVLGPIQSFLRLETSGAIVLLASTMVALVWANSPWSESYERLWTTTFTVRIGDVILSEDLRHWINDGLMTLFFLLVGLEIKRELVTGELREPRSVLLPALAALGGMVVPAAIYAAINAGGPAADGWGIPMATDIAFALGVLTLAARNAPPGLKPFLLTLALVDDVGAIVVIALFYSGGVEPVWALVALGIVAALVALQRIQVRWVPAYVLLGIALWFAVAESGVHATIAGVILGLLTPALPFQRPGAVSAEAKRVADLTLDDPSPPDADAEHWLDLARLSREAVSPLARLEAGLHPWTSLLVIPLFALANAGVRLSGGLIGDEVVRPVVVGIVLGLIVGKFVGVAGAILGGVRLGLGPVPEGVGRRGVLGVASVAGVGFTIALFIADLAFADPELLQAAKVGILAASVAAGAIGFAVLRLHRSRSAPARQG